MAEQFRRGRLIAAIDDTTGEGEINLLAEATIHALRVQGWVWDPDGMVPIKEQQAITDAEFQAALTILESITAKTYWKEKLLDWVGKELIYLGKNTTKAEPEGNATWYIWKFTYVDKNLTRMEGPLIGSWTGRAALGWV